MRKLFLDANVLFTAAHNPDGKAAFLIRSSTEGHWVVVTSLLAAEEARRNLKRKYPDRLAALDELLAIIQVVPSADGSRCPIALPDKDKPIYEAAIRCGATHFLAGDIRDFGPYMNRPEEGDMLIQTVAEFLARV